MNEAEAKSWAQKHLPGWPGSVQMLAVQLLVKYGAPAEIGKRHIIWYANGPFVRTVLYQEGSTHNFPTTHTDVLEQTVAYAVPLEKLLEVARYNGSISVDRTRGEVTSRAEKEESNILTLNLVDEIVRGERDAERARTYHAQVARAWMIREPEPYAEQLRLKSGTKTGDPDEVAPLIRHMSETH